jgi:neurocalcin delta
MGNKAGKEKKDSTKLTEDDISLLIANTTFNREQIIQWHEGFLKDCPKGELDKKKFTDVYKEFYPQGKADKFCAQVFNVFDMDQSGKINFIEFLIAISVSTQNDAKKKLRLAFKMYDIDRNGKIDKKEMEKIIVSIYDLLGEENRKGDNSPKERVAAIFGKLDADKNGYLTEDEFIEGCASDPVLMGFLAPNA